MRLQLSRVTDPASEPLTLADAKAQLRVDHTSEDTFITDLITAAREYVEEDLGISLLEQTWEQRFPCFKTELKLARPPLIALSSIDYLDEDAAEQSVATPSDLYRTDTVSLPGRLLADPDADFPTSVLSAPDAVRVQFTAGYSTVPEPLIAALKLVVAALYERRGDPTEHEPLQLPDAYVWLTQPYRKVSF